MPFAGFPVEGLAFLRELAANNQRDWFKPRQPEFRRWLQDPAENFVAEVEPRLGREYTGKVFRVPRDVRFSTDKTPYNTHLRLGFSADGRAGRFLSLEADGQVIVGLGTFEFSKTQLPAYRQAVAGDAGAELERLVGPWRLDPPELKRVPAPFESDHPRAGLLRRKGLTVWRDEPTPSELHDRRFVDWCLTTWTRMSPVADWMTSHGL